jgi:hypothetical protein
VALLPTPDELLFAVSVRVIEHDRGAGREERLENIQRGFAPAPKAYATGWLPTNAVIRVIGKLCT